MLFEVGETLVQFQRQWWQQLQCHSHGYSNNLCGQPKRKEKQELIQKKNEVWGE